MGGVAAFIIICLCISGGIGAAIGNTKGKPGAGFALGFFLGWIGWIIIAVMSRSPQAEAQRQVAIAAETSRLTGSPQPWAQTSTVGGSRAALPRPSSDVTLGHVRAAAGSDPEAARLFAAVDGYARFANPVSAVLSWCFGTQRAETGPGQAVFVARSDGRVVCGLGSGSAFVVDVPQAEYRVTPSNVLVELRLGSLTVIDPRPAGPAMRLLNAVNATRIEVDEPAAAVVAPAPVSSGLVADAPVGVMAGSPDAVRAAIRTLAEMHADGLITTDEFDSKRRELLDRL